jgi:hypothetical protein
VLDTAALAYRHEIGDHGGAGLGHLGDLLHRSAHRNRMFDNLFRIRLEVVTSGAVVIDPPAERPGAGQRFGHHDAVVADGGDKFGTVAKGAESSETQQKRPRRGVMAAAQPVGGREIHRDRITF